MAKNLAAMQETPVRALGGEDPLEKGKATHSSILAWRIPWTAWNGVHGVANSGTEMSDFHFHYYSVLCNSPGNLSNRRQKER